MAETIIDIRNANIYQGDSLILQDVNLSVNTVATILKILVEKEFVDIKIFGRQHQYYPLVSKEAYSKASIKNLVKGYFGGSFSEAVSFMVKENNISLEDLETLLQQLKKGKK